MDTKQATVVARDALEKKYGDAFSEDAFKKAVEKLKRWLRAAHGGLEWDELNDVAESVDFYYQETLEDTTNGKYSSNRDGFGIGLKRNFKI